MAPPAEVSDPAHAPALLRQLNEQRLHGLFCDVTLIAGDTKFPAHRSVLAASSPFFREALLAPPAPPPPGGPAPPPPARVLELPGVPAAAFSDVLNFIYSARLALPGDDAGAAQIEALGRRLGIPRLQELGDGDPWGDRAEGQDEWAGDEPGTTKTPSPARAAPAAAAPAAPRLPRPRRPLSCPRCGKGFIHAKRLQTHETQCRRSAGRAVGGGVDPVPALAPPEPAPPPPPPPAPPLAAAAYRAGQEHLVKVVGGHLLYVCAACERSYVTLSSLKRHANVHSWRRKYPCRYCEKVFALAEYRTKHEVWHTGERRYQCIFCWETFVTYYNLKTHQRAFHGISPGFLASEKTPNGGYKPKVNTLKLYRLLPMRAQKRPYKTYSQGGAPLPVAPSALAPPAPGDAPPPPPPPPAQEPRPEPGVAPSVITFGRPAPSVIVHSGTVAGAMAGPVAATPAPALPGGQAASVIAYSCPPRPPKKREYPPPAGPAAGMTTAAAAAGTTEEGPEPKGRGARPARTLTYTAKPAGGGAGEGRGGAGGGGAPGGSGGPPPLCQITVRIGEEAIVTRRISETDLRPGETRDGGGDGESEDEESEREAGGDGDELWRPYYSYKPKRRGCGGGPPKVRRAPRGWRRKPERRPATGWGDDGAGAEAGAGGEASPAGRAGDWKHQCGVCGKSFSALKKLRKHQEAHGGAQAARAGRRPSARFACPHCAKVCKTAAALGRHAQRHAGERAPPGGGGGAPTAVIAYTKGPGGGASGARGPGPGPGQGPGVKEEEAPQEMHVSSSSGEAGQGEAAAGEAASLQDPVISGGEEPAGYPPQEFPLPLVGPRARREGCAAAAAEKGGGGGYPSAIQFGGAGDGEAGPKVAFYPEPYPLVYGPQLLAAYPYNFGNLAALPVALNMVLPDEKGGALPFLPGVFGYAVNPRAAPTPPPAAPQPAPLPPPGRPGGEGAGAGGRSEAGRGM